MKHLIIIVTLFISVTLIGCSPSTQLTGLVPASGTLTFDGKPVEGAMVIFVPKPGQSGVRSASATTDASGKFTLMTLQPKDGIYPGEYAVTVEKTQETGELREESGGGERSGKTIDTRMIADLLPQKYRDLDTTDLSVSMPAKGNKEIVLELTGTVDAAPKRPDERTKR